MKTRLLLLFFFGYLLSANTYAQENEKFPIDVLINPQSNTAFFNEVFFAEEIPELEIIASPNTFYLYNGYAQSSISNTKQWNLLKDSVDVQQVTVVFSKYPKNKKNWKTNYYKLLSQRLINLFGVDPELNSNEIMWSVQLQNNCQTAEEAKVLFHGFVIKYVAKSYEHPAVRPIEPEPEELEVNFNDTDTTEMLNNMGDLIADLEHADSLALIMDRLSFKEKKEMLIRLLEKEHMLIPENEISKITPKYLRKTERRVAKFIERHTYIANDQTVNDVLTRHKEWTNSLVVMDWTGSMYPYGAQVLLWHVLNFEESGVKNFALFNDGDQKNTGQKSIGSTEGIYYEKARNMDRLISLFNLVMMKGGGGDGPENDVEALLEATTSYPNFDELILIADNNSCVRDMEMLYKLKIPVRVVLCGYSEYSGANPQYLEIAKKTGGSLHTAEEDIYDLMQRKELLNDSVQTELYDFSVITVRRNCRRGIFSGIDSRRTKQLAKYKTYRSLATAASKPKLYHKLDLSAKDLSYIDELVFKLKNLRELDYSFNNLSELPEDLGDLKNLRVLELGGNELKKLNINTKELKKLQKIDIKSNQIRTLPSSIDKLQSLTELNVSGNKLKKLPSNIKHLKNLEKLYLANNKIKKLPDGYGYLKGLTEVDLSHNRLSVLPKTMSGLRALTKADYSYNQIRDLNTSIGATKQLEQLNVSHNKLEMLPSSMGNLRKMTLFDASYNFITEIPRRMTALKKLERVNLSHNKIQALPRNIGYWRNVEWLDLSYNELSVLTDKMKTMKSLKFLNLRGNPMPDTEIIKIQKLLPNTVIVF